MIDDVDGRVSRALHQIVVAHDVSHAESQGARLASAEEFAGAAELEVALRDFESIAGIGKKIEPLFFLVGNQNGVRLPLAASDAPAQLMQLREAEAIGIHDQHDRGVRDIDADFDHRRADENVDVAGFESLHRCFLVSRRHAPVQHRDLAMGKAFADRFESLLERLQVQLFRFFDDRIDNVDLRAGPDLILDETVDALELRARPDSGLDRRASRGKLVDHR